MAPVYQSTILFPASTVTLSAISHIGGSISAVLQVSVKLLRDVVYQLQACNKFAEVFYSNPEAV